MSGSAGREDVEAEAALSLATEGTIRETIAAHPAVERAVLFGSRAKGTHRKNSDIDIALWGDLTSLQAEALRIDLDELPTPYRFDIIAYRDIRNPALKSHIDRVGRVLFSR
jgi:predicted nucleotidyltransferase